MRMYALVGLMLSMCLGSALAGEMPGYTPPKTSDALEQIKALDGRWEGVSNDHDQKAGPVVAQYHVTSGGSAVEEKLFCDSSHEMISMYHDVNGELSMAHYCMLGNQPQLVLTSSEPGKLTFKESASSAATLAGQMRMGSLTVEWTDKDNIVQTWQAYDAEDKPMDPTVIKLTRNAPNQADLT